MTQHIGQQVIQLTHVISDIIADYKAEDVDADIAFDAIATQLFRLQGLGLSLGATIKDLVPVDIDEDDFIDDMRSTFRFDSEASDEPSREEMLLTLSIEPFFLDPSHFRYIAQDLGITPQFLVTDYTDQEIGEIYDVITGTEPTHDLPILLSRLAELSGFAERERAIHPAQEDSKEIEDILRDHK
jgi:hypothetical protein